MSTRIAFCIAWIMSLITLFAVPWLAQYMRPLCAWFLGSMSLIVASGLLYIVHLRCNKD